MSLRGTIDPALVALAKAGDLRAVNEVLRRAEPAIRRTVRHLARLRRLPWVVQEAVLSEAMEKAWRAIPTWDPEISTLSSYVDPSIKRSALVASMYFGHAVKVKRDDGASGAGRYAAEKARASQAAGDLGPLLDTRPARAASPDTLHDVARILNALSPAERTILIDVAAGVTFPEIGAEMGVTKQYAHKLHGDAMAHARKVARRGLFK